MKAIRLDQPQQFARIDIPEPPAPAAGEAVVRVHRIGICGTDYGGYLGKMPFYSYPRIPGHELGVEVLAVGPGVTNVKPGDRCSVEPYINCQTCYSCRRGFTNCCENHKTLGVMCDGGMAEKFLLPARKLHLSTKLSYDQPITALGYPVKVGSTFTSKGLVTGTAQGITFSSAFGTAYYEQWDGSVEDEDGEGDGEKAARRSKRADADAAGTAAGGAAAAGNGV